MKKIITIRQIGIIISPFNNNYLASIPYEILDKTDENIDEILNEAAKIYKFHLSKMRHFLERRALIKKRSKFIPARYMWQIGNEIFELRESLSRIGLFIENLYGNLSRDLNISRTVIKRLVSLRRYFPNKESLPEDLSWGKIKDGPKKFASTK